MLIDSHCHLNLAPLFSQLTTVLQTARSHGVQYFIVPAVQETDWPILEKLSQHSDIACAIGLHPCFSHCEHACERLIKRLELPHPFIALGECGLDAVSSPDSMAQQMSRCTVQLKLAQQHQLPVILHVRKAHHELLQLLKKTPLPAGGVLHGFSGSLDLARQYLRYGLKIGVGGVISYPRAAKTRHTMAQLPLESLVLETDSPDMPLNGYQGQMNQPSQCQRIFSHLCQLRAEDVSQIKAQIFDNTVQLFQLQR